MALCEKRQETLKRIAELEHEGKLNENVWNDPPFSPLVPGQVDYLKKKLSSKIKNKISNFALKKFIKTSKKNNQYILKDVIGIEKLENLQTGAIITSNHFNPFDSVPISETIKKVYGKKKKFHIIIAEKNYAGGQGFFGSLFRNQNTIPLAKNTEVMKECFKAVDYYLTRGDFILIYPEQELWENYRKPRPLKEGAFRFAIKSNVPVVACFITMNDSEFLDGDGGFVQEYTLHILDVIYPKKELSYKENIRYMKDENEKLTKQIYEKIYGIKLVYNTKD